MFTFVGIISASTVRWEPVAVFSDGYNEVRMDLQSLMQAIEGWQVTAARFQSQGAYDCLDAMKAAQVALQASRDQQRESAK